MSPKSIRGEMSPQNLYLRWFETFLSSWILSQGNLMMNSWILDKGWGRRITNIYENCYLYIKCSPANSLTALMWRWYLNSEQAALQLVVESSGRCEMGQGEAPITKFIWEGGQRKEDQKKNSRLLIKLLWPSYSSYVEDDFYILYSQYFFQTTYNRYLLSKIRLVLFPTLYKFIVWASWAKTQSCLGSKPKLILTIPMLLID